MTTTHTITDLHAHLFATLQGLRDGTVSIEQAELISKVSQTLINAAKVEVEYLRVTDQRHGSGFLPSPPTTERELPNGITRIVEHRIKR